MLRHTLIWIFLGISALFLVATAQAAEQDDKSACFIQVGLAKHEGRYYAVEHINKICEGTHASCIVAQTQKMSKKISKNTASTALSQIAITLTAISTCHPTYAMNNPEDATKCFKNIKRATLKNEYKEYACESEGVRLFPNEFVQCTQDPSKTELSDYAKVTTCLPKEGAPVRPARRGPQRTPRNPRFQ